MNAEQTIYTIATAAATGLLIGMIIELVQWIA